MGECNANEATLKTSSKPRSLTADEEDCLKQQDLRPLSDFKKQQLENNLRKNWDIFYKRNTTKFFKDRHWTTREFEELGGVDLNGETMRILEVGCGVGNLVLPLLEETRHIFFACDFSPRAIDLLKQSASYQADRCTAFCCDVTADDLSATVPAGSCDLATLVFVLSAISPDKMVDALRNIVRVLKQGGCLLFRDYGLYDHAMLRFGPGHKLADNCYVRQDGTRTCFFTTEGLSSLFQEAGYDVALCQYVSRQTVNVKENVNVERTFVQGKFIKTGDTVALQPATPTS